MQKFLALTDVNFLDPLPALGDRAPRDYEKPVEPQKNLFHEFEVGDYSLAEKPAPKTTAPKKHYTHAEALQARKNAVIRTGLLEPYLNDRLGDYFAKINAWNGRSSADLDTLAYVFFESCGALKEPAGRTVTVGKVLAAASTAERYMQAKKAVGVLLDRTPTPEQHGAMLTWIEQNA